MKRCEITYPTSRGKVHYEETAIIQCDDMKFRVNKIAVSPFRNF